MSYFGVQTNDEAEPFKYFDTLEEAQQLEGVVYIFDSTTHAGTLYLSDDQR